MKNLVRGLENKNPLWLLESAADAMLVTDRNGCIVFSNKSAEMLFGHEGGKLSGLAVETLIPPLFREKHLAKKNEAHSVPRAMRSGLQLYGLKKDGSEIAIDVSLSPLEDGYTLVTAHDIARRRRAEDGYTPGTVHDIAHRRRAEDALADQSARLAAIVETAVDAIITIDEKGIIDSFNPAAERIFGYKREEALGRNVSMLMPSPHREAHDDYIGHYLKSAERRIIGIGRETLGLRKDGTTFPIELSVSEMKVGDHRMFTGVVKDITLRKEAEESQARLIHELESANDELKNFAYVVSHDLKAPLRAIGSLADWISADQSERLDDEGREHLRLLIQRARRMDSLIDGILQYSRVGRVRETKVNVDLNEIVKESLSMLAPPPDIRVEVAPGLPIIHAEQTRMLQLFQNLLSNAIKYLDKPEGLIRIGFETHQDDWEFSVSDNGCGIEPKHFKRIFQLFQTLVPKDRVESTGVGLALVKKIVELYGGRIWIESEPAVGSTFFFTLPRSGKKEYHENTKPGNPAR